MRQSTRVGVRLLVVDGDDGDLEDGVSEMGGSVGRLGPDTVDQPPQRSVDPVCRLPPLEVPDVVRGLGDDVVRQTESTRDLQLSGESAHQRTRALICDLLVVFDVAEHGSRLGLGLEDR